MRAAHAAIIVSVDISALHPLYSRQEAQLTAEIAMAVPMSARQLNHLPQVVLIETDGTVSQSRPPLLCCRLGSSSSPVSFRGDSYYFSFPASSPLVFFLGNPRRFSSCLGFSASSLLVGFF